jgi:transcriptional regulator with XRE-family HTH domain
MKTPKEMLGTLLRQWRRSRNVSQLELAMRADTSQRNVSFVESGRTHPSREMVLKLTDALDLPLRARNEVLLAAGYAPFYPDRSLTGAGMELPYRMLERMLAHHEPYPAMVLDAGWNVVMHNRAAGRIFERSVAAPALAEFSSPKGLNFLRLVCDPRGMRNRIRNWPHVGRALLARLRREALAYPDGPSESLLRDLLTHNQLPQFSAGEPPLEAVMSVELDLGDDCLRLFNTLTTFGTPQDIVLQELRIEMSFPADNPSDAILRNWESHASALASNSSARGLGKTNIQSKPAP